MTIKRNDLGHINRKSHSDSKFLSRSKHQWCHYIICQERIAAFKTRKLAICGLDFLSERKNYTDIISHVTCPNCLDELKKIGLL